MKKIYILLFLFLSLLVASPELHGQKDGWFPQIEQGKFSTQIGYLGDFVGHRKLRCKDLEVHRILDTWRLKRKFHGVHFATRFNDRIEFTGKLGYADHELMNSNVQNDEELANEYLDLTKILTRPGISFGLGIESVVFQKEHTRLSVHGELLRDQSVLSHGWRPDGSEVQQNEEHSKLHDTSWVLSARLSRQMGQVLPYIGAQYLQSRLTTTNREMGREPNGDAVIANKNKVGLLLGVSFMRCGQKYLTIEGRCFHESALSFSGHVKF